MAKETLIRLWMPCTLRLQGYL